MGRGVRIKTRFPGVAYREHHTRKHNGKPDRYWIIRYYIDGKQKEESLGWSSQGWNAQKANTELGKLKANQQVGEGPRSLQEKREKARKEREAKAAAKLMQEREKLTFAEVWPHYFSAQEDSGKAASSVQREKSLFNTWLEEHLGPLPLKDIGLLDLERLRKAMEKKGRAPRSRQYAMAVTRQVFNWAASHGFYDGKNPITNLPNGDRKRLLGIPDNKRRRFLTREEARLLLDNIKERSQQLYEICLLSLFAGLRAGEIASLKWGQVDLDSGVITILDSKSGKDRAVPLCQELKEMFGAKQPGRANQLVFPSREGEEIKQVSKAFGRAVDAVGLNDGVEDRRLRVTFHTLRHTFASWAVQAGKPLYAVGKALGHSTSTMTERYSHLAPDDLQAVVTSLEGALTPPKEENKEENVVHLRPGG